MRAYRALIGIRTRSLLFRRQTRYPIALSGQLIHMMVPMRLAFRRPSRIQPARGGFRILPDESECPVLHRMEQHDGHYECISDLHPLYSS